MRSSLARVLLVTLLSVIPARAQFAVSERTNIAAKDVLQILQHEKECNPGQPITVEVLKQHLPLQFTTYAVSFYDRNGEAIPVSSENGLQSYTPSGIAAGAPIADAVLVTSTDEKLSHAIKQACKFVKTLITVQVMDARNLTLSSDARGTGQSPGEQVANDLYGRVTHTDVTNMYVVVNGEHALLDCFEHRKGCTPLAPGTYYGNLDLDKRSIWINHILPLTHQPLRDHYVIAGAW
jgi:hypothetical protein